MTIYSMQGEWYKELSAMTNGISVPFNNSNKTPQVIEAAALSRGGTMTKDMYMATMDSVKDDVELSAVYAAYSKEVIG